MLDEHTGLHNLIGGIQSATTNERAQLRLHLITTNKLTEKYSQNDSHSQDEWEKDSVFIILIHQ